MSDQTFILVFAAAAYFLAAIFFAVGFYVRSKIRRLLRSALVTKGAIVSLEPTVSMKSPNLYRVFFSFKDAQGREYRVQSSSYANPGDYRVGDAVDVFYDPESPQEAITDPKKSLSLARVCLGAASAAAIVATVMLLTRNSWHSE